MNIMTYNYLHKETQYTSKITTTSLSLLETHLESLTKAMDIVDAQFYYSNPLLGVILDKDEDMDKHAQLWGNYYLLSIDDWDSLKFNGDIFIANQCFCEFIDFEEILNIEDFKTAYNDHGMYLIGIYPEKEKPYASKK